MNNIRKAVPKDASRIAEIIITNYRMNFYPFFKNDEFYFDELNVIDMAEDYKEGTDELNNTYVYDDGVVKGIIRIKGNEIEKLYVEPTFQSVGIGAQLLDFAVNEMGADFLWALEYNKRGIAFYRRHGFELTGEKMIEDEWVPLLKMALINK
ncbi:MAG: GNAT family N-acetyltransferase [Ruminococcus sp.]|nr:GNAT family N-acetyltransferase [Ruminococcus sp.]